MVDIGSHNHAAVAADVAAEVVDDEVVGEVVDEPADPAGLRLPLTRVVVADDADGVRELMCLLLDTEPDFTVVGCACNGAEAVEVVGDTLPDLVLLDVAMPVLDGLGALPLLRRIAPDACVVVFSGFSEASLREQALALGADAMLEKGVATGSLVAALRTACHARRAGFVAAEPRRAG